MLTALLLLVLQTGGVSGTVPGSSATTPTPRDMPWWTERHADCVKLSQDRLDVALIGDSITHAWESQGRAAWGHVFGHVSMGNFGFSGDQTGHVLWRLDNGEVIGSKPRVAVVMIGTNNLGGGQGPEEAAEGVKAVVERIRKGSPDTKILLLGIFPREEAPDAPLRLKTIEATKLFAGLDDGKRVFFLDIGRHFVRADGTLRTMLMPDRLHLNPEGYEIWAKAMGPTVFRLLQSGTKSPEPAPKREPPHDDYQPGPAFSWTVRR